MKQPRILIAGVGNIFFGDDAFGVEVAQRLLRRCSSRRFSRKASGSNNTMGYSNSIASSNIAGASTGTRSVRRSRAPRQLLQAQAFLAKALAQRNLRQSGQSAQIPHAQRSSVASRRADSFCSSSSFFFPSHPLANKTSTDRDPKVSLSFPGGITVTPEKPRAANMAASGFDATATFPCEPCPSSALCFDFGETQLGDARTPPASAKLFLQTFPNLGRVSPSFSKDSFGGFVGFQWVASLPNQKDPSPNFFAPRGLEEPVARGPASREG